jgi:hypothetical protein
VAYRYRQLQGEFPVDDPASDALDMRQM